MNSAVVYATRTGNTQKIAEAIAEALRSRGPVTLLSAEQATRNLPDKVDLLVIGGPTEGHGMTPPVRALLEGFGRRLAGTNAAGFDTRLSWPLLLSGSAAIGIVKRLHKLGARVVAPAESFIVTKQPLLEAGEVERATAWATELADKVEVPATA